MTDEKKLIWILGSAVFFMLLGAIMGYFGYRKDQKMKLLSNEEKFTIDPFDILLKKVPRITWGILVIFFGFYLVYYGFSNFSH